MPATDALIRANSCSSSDVEKSNYADSESSEDHIESDKRLIDPFCVAEKPHVISFQDITSAAFLIKSGIEMTPCTVSKIFHFTLIRIFKTHSFAESKNLVQRHGNLLEKGVTFVYWKVNIS